MIKTVICDLGGVILTDDDAPVFSETFFNTFHLTREHISKGWNAALPSFMVGKITEDQFWYQLLSTAGSSVMDIQKAKEIWRLETKPIEGMFSLLEQIKKQYTLVALSNIGREQLAFKNEKYHLSRYFSFIISSGAEGISKSNPEIFKTLLQKGNFKAEECLFIDDREKNIVIAKALGMETILFKGAEDLKSQLASRGLI